MLLLIIWSLKHWEWLDTELWQRVNKRPNEEQKILPVAVKKYCPREIINQTPWCEVKKYIDCTGSLINAGVGRLVTKHICHWMPWKFRSTSAWCSYTPRRCQATTTFPQPRQIALRGAAATGCPVHRLVVIPRASLAFSLFIFIFLYLFVCPISQC